MLFHVCQYSTFTITKKKHCLSKMTKKLEVCKTPHIHIPSKDRRDR